MGLALDMEDYHPSVLLHCWLGHLTCKIVSKMTYNVSSGTLNPTLPYHTVQRPCITNSVFYPSMESVAKELERRFQWTLVYGMRYSLLFFLQESADGTDAMKADSFRKILRRASSLPSDVVDSPAVSASCAVTDEPTYSDAAVATDPILGTAVYCRLHCGTDTY